MMRVKSQPQLQRSPKSLTTRSDYSSKRPDKLQSSTFDLLQPLNPVLERGGSGSTENRAAAQLREVSSKAESQTVSWRAQSTAET
jgi:hypothetical protein